MPANSKSSKHGKAAVPRPSEIASENKRHYVQTARVYMQAQQLVPGSLLYADSRMIQLTAPPDASRPYPSVTVLEGDAVDIAISWQYDGKSDVKQNDLSNRMLVLNTANDKRPGGNWESNTTGPEECFARRSNLAQQLRTPWNTFEVTNDHYPMPNLGGLYTLNVVIFRGAADSYAPLDSPKCLPVVSVAPVRRPKLDSDGTTYAFAQERDLMLEKIKTVLRIAAYNGHRDLCLGGFGTGPLYRNPPRDVAGMWRHLLFENAEFRGRFRAVVFAIDAHCSDDALGIFGKVFDPLSIFGDPSA